MKNSFEASKAGAVRMGGLVRIRRVVGLVVVGASLGLGCIVDDSLLDGKECGPNGRCTEGYVCISGPCEGDPAYLCPVCRREASLDGGADADGGGLPETCEQSPPPCKTFPECAEMAPICRQGNWVCDSPGFEFPEKSCDGLDNDCDGRTDEGLVCRFVGTGIAGYLDGTATEAEFNLPRALLPLSDGGLLVADSGNHAIRLVLADGTVSTLAGTGTMGKADGLAKEATFYEPSGLAFAPDGTLIIADRLNHLIRGLKTDGQVVTLAGTGKAGFQNGDASQSQFTLPSGVWVNDQGAVFVADTGNHCIRRMVAGQVDTFAGLCGHPGVQNALGEEARFIFPTDLCAGALGQLVVSENSFHRLRNIDGQGLVTLLAGTGAGGFVDGSLESAQFNRPCGCLFDPETSRLLLADSANHRVRFISSEVGTLLGSGQMGMQDGLLLEASFNFPSSIAILNDGRWVVADTRNHSLRVVLP